MLKSKQSLLAFKNWREPHNMDRTLPDNWIVLNKGVQVMKRLMLISMMAACTGCASSPEVRTCASQTQCMAEGKRAYQSRAYAKALESYERACFEQDAFGCRRTAHMYDTGLGTQRNETLGRQYYEHGCTLGDPGSCDELARWHYKQEKIDKAILYYGYACKHGSGDACWKHAELTRTKHGHAQSVMISKSHRRGCKLGHEASCKASQRPDATYNFEERFLYKACRKKATYACYLLGQKTERRWYIKACMLGHHPSCRVIGMTRPQKTPNPAAFSKSSVATTLRTQQFAYAMCYKYLRRFENEHAQGQVVLMIKIRPDGENEVKVTEIDPMLKSMSKCMAQTTEVLSFPRVREDNYIKKTFVFSFGRPQRMPTP